MLPGMGFGTKIATDLPFSSTEELLKTSSLVISKSTKKCSKSRAGKAKTSFTSLEQEFPIHTALKLITSSSSTTTKTTSKTEASKRDTISVQDG